MSSNACVAGEDELRAIVNDWLKSLDMNAMALLAANGDVINDIGSQGLQGLHKYRCGSLTVHIKVAPDADHLLAADSCADNLYGLFNAREWRRRKRIRMKEGAGGFRRDDAAPEERLRDQRRQVEVREGGGNFYGRRVDPASHKLVPRLLWLYFSS